MVLLSHHLTKFQVDYSNKCSHNKNWYSVVKIFLFLMADH
ncbi:hypothetical protein HMPREF0541_01774 [Lacticaseibacillus rhamnosus ATCC 21052]|nr:hypothetical protein HMPREF0541_01774 [Lacticaseibacillus rhamnosus ATCC 21052]